MRRLFATLLLVLLTTSACGGEPVPELTAEPVPGETGTSPSPTETTPSPSPTETSPSPSPTETETREPTDSDRARFVQQHQPDDADDLEHVAADLDGDGQEELVFSYVRASAGVAHVEVAWWNGREYRIVFSEDGGPATQVDRLVVSDVNEDGLIELVTFQSAEEPAASLTAWQVSDVATVVPLRADGGCNDGRNTYGVIGAELADRDGDGADEIYATCDDSPLPPEAWSTDRYIWGDGAYRYEPEVIS